MSISRNQNFRCFNFEFCASRNYLNQLKYPRSKVRLAIKHHSGASWHLDIEEVFAEKSSEVRTGSVELQKRTLYLPKTTFSNVQRYPDLAISKHIRLNWIALKLLISPLWWYLSSTQKMMVCVQQHCVVAVQKTWRTDSGCGENKNTSTKLSSTWWKNKWVSQMLFLSLMLAVDV